MTSTNSMRRFYPSRAARPFRNAFGEAFARSQAQVKNATNSLRHPNILSTCASETQFSPNAAL
eukprot:4010997-Prorocentrum_lima.AAC.1